MTIHNLMPFAMAGRLAADLELLRALCQLITGRTKRGIAILDALCPDADLEPPADSACGEKP
ncbi:hypothetical protein [Methylobacterium longum]|uniref:Uncharacterized protein n=1 Tax=Methylobacterium longum TaxID=767694 RepID=A0ABT8AWK8_9HYPH|nr:hypothetical protein [Methylobacterium longum]MDN3574281.1 hypothetical protein [Methylobacterium longum]GJE13389.1 hypothetical protein FOHLNKBM_4452 [Methylobacterium longum]